MTPPNQLQAVSWEDWHIGPWYATFERADKPRTYERPSPGSRARLMRTMTLRRLKPKLKWFLRQHAMMEYIDRRAKEAKKKRL